MKNGPLTIWAAAALIELSGCYQGGPEGDAVDTDGAEGEDDDGDGDDGDDTSDPEAPLCDSDASDVSGPRLLRRLTTEELDASVRAAFGFDSQSWGGPSLPPDPAASSGFTNDADRLRVTEAFAAALQITADEVATSVVAPEQLSGLLPCASEGGSDCARQFVTEYGGRLYRRPLSEAEVSRYLELHDAVVADGAFDDFVSVATSTMIQSPNFIYRSELGEPDGDGGYVLSPYEVATALSYTFLGTAPDEALLEEAEQGGLRSTEEVVAAARRLALDESGSAREAFRERVHTFHRQWLGLSSLGNAEKDPTLHPGFDESVKAAMQTEIDRFIEHVVFDSGGGVEELFTLDHSELDAALVDFYGFGEVGGVSPKPEGWGTGLLSLGAVLAAHSTYLATSPTQRGHLVRESILCETPPPPPPDVGDLPEPDPTGTTRERYEMHVSDAACVGCHDLMDPIGFGFERLDATGRFRQEENGNPIDDSGFVSGLDGERVEFSGPVELAHALAGSQTVGECMTFQMASFSLGLGTEDTRCIVDVPARQMAEGELGILDAFISFAGTRHFLERR